MKMYLKQFSLVVLCLVFGFWAKAQEERILNYQVDIEVKEDRSITITEKIKVLSNNFRIRRGITRDLPTRRQLGDHGRQSLIYNIKQVLKDGEKVSYFTEKENNEIIMYIGEKDKILDKGEHEYTIKYTVKNQIAFYDDFEELYWNAIGTKNQFAIDNANVRIAFPKGVEIDETYVYTGFYGEQKEQTGVTQEGNYVELQSIEKLSPYEGVTVSITVPKGTFKKPSFFERRITISLLLMSLASLLFYFLFTWYKYGRDPKGPEVVPVYEPPYGLSPASCGYILNPYSHSKQLVASFMDLAIKNKVKITQKEGGGLWGPKEKFTISKKSPLRPEYKEQAVLMAKLFKINNSHTLKDKYNSALHTSITAHKRSLAEQHKAFLNEGNNQKYVILPILWIIATTVLVAVAFYYEPYTEIAKLPLLVLYPIFSLLILGLYSYLIKKPTMEKLELKAKINGLKEYLSWTEQDFREGYDVDIRDLEHFESLLPYAYALGVVDKWNNSFEDIIKRAKMDNRPSYGFYMYPDFGGHFMRSVNGSTTPPSSSGSGSSGGFSSGGGFGGGGFSGGGGGGGGVGGW